MYHSVREILDKGISPEILNGMTERGEVKSLEIGHRFLSAIYFPDDVRLLQLGQELVDRNVPLTDVLERLNKGMLSLEREALFETFGVEGAGEVTEDFLEDVFNAAASNTATETSSTTEESTVEPPPISTTETQTETENSQSDFDVPMRRRTTRRSRLYTNSEDTTSVEDAPIVEDTTSVEDAPIVEDTTSVEDAPIIEDTTSVEDAPIAEDTTSVEDAPIVEDTTSVEDAPIVEDTTSVEDAPIVEDTTSVEDAPIVEDTTSVEDAPIVEDTTSVEDAPIVEDTTSVEDASIVEDTTPIAEESEVNLSDLVQDLSSAIATTLDVSNPFDDILNPETTFAAMETPFDEPSTETPVDVPIEDTPDTTETPLPEFLTVLEPVAFVPIQLNLFDTISDTPEIPQAQETPVVAPPEESTDTVEPFLSVPTRRRTRRSELTVSGTVPNNIPYSLDDLKAMDIKTLQVVVRDYLPDVLYFRRMTITQLLQVIVDPSSRASIMQIAQQKYDHYNRNRNRSRN